MSFDSYDYDSYFPELVVPSNLKKINIETLNSIIYTIPISGEPIPYSNNYIARNIKHNQLNSESNGHIQVYPPKKDYDKTTQQIKISYNSNCKIDYNYSPLYFFDTMLNQFVINLSKQTLTFKRTNSIYSTIWNLDIYSNSNECSIFISIKGKNTKQQSKESIFSYN